jgi:hypothetical protein
MFRRPSRTGGETLADMGVASVADLGRTASGGGIRTPSAIIVDNHLVPRIYRSRSPWA